MSEKSDQFWAGLQKWFTSLKIDSISIAGVRVGFRGDAFNTPAYQSILELLQSADSRSADVFVITAHNMDEVYSIDVIASDHECDSEMSEAHPGGSGANTAFALSAFGRRVAVTGSVGKDAIGEKLLSHLQSAGVETRLVARTEGDSGRTVTIVEDSGRRLIVVRQGANASFDHAVDYQSVLAAANDTRVLHASSFVSEGGRNFTEKLFKEVRPEVITTLTPGALYSNIGLDRIEGLLRHTNVIFLYREQLVQAIENSTARPLLKGDGNQSLMSAYFAWKQKIGFSIPQILVVKDPLQVADGMLGQTFLTAGVGDQELEKFVPSRSLNRGARYHAIDTTGAGDSSAAGFIHAMLTSSPLEHAVDAAFVMAALASVSYGARTAIESTSMLHTPVSSEKSAFLLSQISRG